MTSVAVPGLPFPLDAQGGPPCGCETTDGALRLTGQAGTDLFVDPAGGGEPPDAGRLVGPPPEGDFTLAARVRVEFASRYDAGVLLVMRRTAVGPNSASSTRPRTCPPR